MFPTKGQVANFVLRGISRTALRTGLWETFPGGFWTKMGCSVGVKMSMSQIEKTSPEVFRVLSSSLEMLFLYKRIDEATLKALAKLAERIPALGEREGKMISMVISLILSSGIVIGNHFIDFESIEKNKTTEGEQS